MKGGISDNTKDLGDLIAGSSVIGVWASYLPEIAALFAILWTGIRIYEWARVRLLNKPPFKALD